MFKSAGGFGAAIRQKRKGVGWTRAELATRSGTGERFIVELEASEPSGQHNWRCG